MELWCPWAAIDDRGGSGAQSLDDPIIVLHTTETRNPASYNNTEPTFEVSLAAGVIQFAALNRSAKALYNAAGGVETNRRPGGCIQIEIVWYAADAENMPDELLRVLGRLMRWIADQLGIGLVLCPQGFHGAGEGFVLASEFSPIRFGNDIRWPAGEWNHPGSVSGIPWTVTSHQDVGDQNCVAPDTPVLCADLVWRPAGDLVVGDELIAPEEHAAKTGERTPGRRLTMATVEFVGPGRKPCLRVTTDRGSVVCSTDHPWLRHHPKTGGASRWRWAEADGLRAGDHLHWFAEPWRVDRSWGAGWLAGLLDADGSLHMSERPNKGRFWALAFGQRSGQTLTDYEMEMGKRGFVVKVVPRGIRPTSLAKQPFFDVPLLGGKREIMRALGTLRPPRLLAHPRVRELWDGAALGKPTAGSYATVISIEPVGEQDIASITTSTRTFIAAGMPCHNTHWDTGLLPWERLVPFFGYTEPDDPTDHEEEDVLTPAESGAVQNTWLYLSNVRDIYYATLGQDANGPNWGRGMFREANLRRKELGLPEIPEPHPQVAAAIESLDGMAPLGPVDLSELRRSEPAECP